MARLAHPIDPAECAFCAIVGGVSDDVAMVAERADAVAFLDRSPLFKGHVLVVPRAHLFTLDELAPPALGELFELVREVSSSMPAALGAQGTFVAVNNRVSQSVAHLHVHVVPRSAGDGLRGFFWPRQRYAEGEAAEYAARLRAVLDAAPDPATPTER